MLISALGSESPKYLRTEARQSKCKKVTKIGRPKDAQDAQRHEAFSFSDGIL